MTEEAVGHRVVDPHAGLFEHLQELRQLAEQVGRVHELESAATAREALARDVGRTRCAGCSAGSRYRQVSARFKEYSTERGNESVEQEERGDAVGVVDLAGRAHEGLHRATGAQERQPVRARAPH